MHAIVAQRYGPPDVLEIVEREEPECSQDGLLIEVWATSVTAAEWRIRAGDFGTGFSWLGRLMFGLRRPRQPTTGQEFAGRVLQVGPAVTGFAVGDDVFGVRAGANAERIAMPASGVVTRMPSGLTHAQAVSLPFGGLCAIDFLEDKAQLRAGERVLIVGASGGVGAYLVQVAASLGAHVTAVCSGPNAAFVRELGANSVVDYRVTDPQTLPGPYDVVVDTIGKTSFRRFRPMLSQTGRHVFIEGGAWELLQSLLPRFGPGPRVVGGVTEDSREGLERLRERVEAGRIRPVLGHRYSMHDVVEAHRLVESRHRRGAVVLDFGVSRSEPVPVPTP
ncbi:MAG: NAD(P)-dependent alcohol dehydrogenase [Nannocystales bacterium]